MRVPISIESIAHVLIAGRSTFKMTYEYESVNGQHPPRLRLKVADASVLGQLEQTGIEHEIAKAAEARFRHNRMM